MTHFLAAAPTLDCQWRAIVLFGRNVASYKFALAKTLLKFANRGDDYLPLSELAEPFAGHLCEHLRRIDKQTISSSSTFLDACRAFNARELSKEKLVEATVRLGFNNVIDAFHVLGAGPIPIRFFVDERKSRKGKGGIRLTDEFRQLAASTQGMSLEDEAEARWRLVETAWQLNLPRAGITVQADTSQNLLFIERVRRVNLTGVQAALNGYQRGKCFYCRTETPLSATDVDHFFPWLLKERGAMPDADGIWNLVLACRRCNRGERGKFAVVPASHLVERLHERNNWLVDSHHPLRETIMLQTGQDKDTRAAFLRSRQRIALNTLIYCWEPEEDGS